MSRGLSGSPHAFRSASFTRIRDSRATPFTLGQTCFGVGVVGIEELGGVGMHGWSYLGEGDKVTVSAAAVVIDDTMMVLVAKRAKH